MGEVEQVRCIDVGAAAAVSRLDKHTHTGEVDVTARAGPEKDVGDHAERTFGTAVAAASPVAVAIAVAGRIAAQLIYAQRVRDTTERACVVPLLVGLFGARFAYGVVARGGGSLSPRLG